MSRITATSEMPWPNRMRLTAWWVVPNRVRRQAASSRSSQASRNTSRPEEGQPGGVESRTPEGSSPPVEDVADRGSGGQRGRRSARPDQSRCRRQPVRRTSMRNQTSASSALETRVDAFVQPVAQAPHPDSGLSARPRWRRGPTSGRAGSDRAGSDGACEDSPRRGSPQQVSRLSPQP